MTDETGNIVYRYAYSPYGERMGTYDGNGNRISDDTPIRFLYNGRFGVETDQNGLYYMRARYYNTDIKRFLNRDILSGSIENSQSLNQYSYVQGNPVSLTDPFGLCPEGGGTENVKNLLGHTVLDILGFVPVIGFAFDIANGIWYAKEKNGLMAASCFIAAIPGAGDLFGTGIKWLAKGEKAIKTAQAVSTTFRMVGAIAQTGLATINLGIAMYALKEEYQSSYNGRVSTLSLVNLGASVLGVAIGIHSSKKSIQNFKSMWNGMRSKGGKGVLDNANYAQKTYSNNFSAEGRKIYSDLAGEPINTIDDLANAINSGKVNVADLPIEYIVRDGNTLILNTRTSQALTRAGIPRSQWNAVNRTGDVLFEELLTGQLTRNKLTSEGISTVRLSGGH